MTDRNPGPELDAEVAPLMGWTRLPGDSDHHDGYWRSPEGETTPADQLTLPPWSTNNAAAWAVVEHMTGSTGSSYDFELSVASGKGGWWTASFLPETKGWGDTAPHAICLAALQAMGAEQ